MGPRKSMPALRRLLGMCQAWGEGLDAAHASAAMMCPCPTLIRPQPCPFLVSLPAEICWLTVCLWESAGGLAAVAVLHSLGERLL